MHAQPKNTGALCTDLVEATSILCTVVSKETLGAISSNSHMLGALPNRTVAQGRPSNIIYSLIERSHPSKPSSNNSPRREKSPRMAKTKVLDQTGRRGIKEALQGRGTFTCRAPPCRLSASPTTRKLFPASKGTGDTMTGQEQTSVERAIIAHPIVITMRL